MENIKRFTSFFKDYNDELIEHLDGVRTYLQTNNTEYKDLQKQYTKILDNNEKIQNILFGDKIEDTLTTEEYDFLYKAIELQAVIEILSLVIIFSLLLYQMYANALFFLVLFFHPFHFLQIVLFQNSRINLKLVLLIEIPFLALVSPKNLLIR